MEPKKHLVFVYGSLLSGLYNNTLLESSKLVYKSATTVDKVLLMGPNSTAFPYLVYFLSEYSSDEENSSLLGHVEGEVYEVDDTVLATLDMVEGHPNHYVRIARHIKTPDNQIVKAYVYVILQPDIDPIDFIARTKKSLTPCLKNANNNFCWKETRSYLIKHKFN